MKVKIGSSYPILLIIFLVFTILLIKILENYEGTGDEIFDSDSITVTDRTYYNKYYRFKISVPTADWSITYYGGIDSLRPENPELGILNNINLIAKFERKHKDSVLTVVDVGIIDLAQPEVPHLLAMQCLEEIIGTYQNLNKNITIIKDVTSVVSGPLKGAYFVVDLPAVDEGYPFPKWVVMFVIKDNFAYSIICQVSRENYNLFRDDFQEIISSFRFI